MFAPINKKGVSVLLLKPVYLYEFKWPRLKFGMDKEKYSPFRERF